MEKDYEAMIILRETTDAGAKKIREAVEKVFKKVGAKVLNLQVWGKRALGYKIKGLSEGYYLLYEIALDPSQAAALQSKMEPDDEILRCLLTVRGKSGEVKRVKV